MPSGSVSGDRNPIRIVPGAIAETSSARRPRHPDDRVGALEQAPRLAQRRTRLGVPLVGVAGGRSGAALDHDLEPVGDQPADGFGHEGDPAFAGGSLAGNGNPHSRNLREGIWGRGRNLTERDSALDLHRRDERLRPLTRGPRLAGRRARRSGGAPARLDRHRARGVCGSAPRCTTSARSTFAPTFSASRGGSTTTSSPRCARIRSRAPG